MIKDTLGNPVSYLNIQLEAGQDSAPISLIVTAQAGDKLTASSRTEASIRGNGGGGYQDLSTSPLIMSAGDNAVTIIVRAGSVSGLIRVALSLSLPVSSPAGWGT